MKLIHQFLNSPKAIVWVLLGHFISWMVGTLFVDVHADMADHWVWSRFLDFGYYEHPPVVALTMKIATLLGGDNVITLKIGAIVFSTLIAFLAYKVGVQFFNRKTAVIFILILEVTPYFSVGSIFWHIDQPYMACWLVGMWLMGKYLKEGRRKWILWLGVVLGIGAESKYIMALFPLSLLVWCILTAEGRKFLLNPFTYMAALLAVVLILPNLYWNYTHEWVTFTYNFEKGLTKAVFGVQTIVFTAGQLFLFSLVYSVYFWKLFFTKKFSAASLFPSSDQAYFKFLLWMGLVPMLFFTITSSFGSRSDPHWVNVGYFSLFLFLARFIELELDNEKCKKQLRIFSSALLLNVCLVLFVFFQINLKVLPLPGAGYKMSAPLVGWAETASQIKQVVEEKGKTLPPFVITREYNLGGALSLYMENQPVPHSIEKPIRNVWSPVEEVLRKGAVFVFPTKETHTLGNGKARFGDHFEYIGNIKTLHNGFEVRDMQVYYLPGRMAE